VAVLNVRDVAGLDADSRGKVALGQQAVAPTGSIAISEKTRKFVEGYFALKPIGPTKVKGVTEPVNVYEVTGLGPLRTRLQRSVGRGSRSSWAVSARWPQ
jgi:hypothetical protein